VTSLTATEVRFLLWDVRDGVAYIVSKIFALHGYKWTLDCCKSSEIPRQLIGLITKHVDFSQ